MLVVNVTHFETISTQTEGTITVYVVNVKYSHQHYYCLSKRYSDFSDLHNNMKDFLPSSYKFPNKSIFSTTAQFTKERRIKGFDEMLKLLIKLDPFPIILQRFLELQERVSTESKKNFLFLTYPSPTSNDGQLKNKESSGSGKQNRRYSVSRYPSLANMYVSQSGYEIERCRGADNVEESTETRVRKQFPKIFLSSMKISSVVYLLSVVLHVVDVSRTSLTQMVVTLVALGLLVCFARVIRFKIEARNTAAESVMHGEVVQE